MTRQEREERIRGWLSGRIPQEWFEVVELTTDREEITVVGTLTAPRHDGDVSPAERAATEMGRIKEFRERTRDDRIRIARELEHATGQKVAWGALCGETRETFTTLSVPVMTRLRQSERRVLDTLVESGVARTRSEALAWCVKLVGKHAESWLGELRTAMAHVDRVRSAGPDATSADDPLSDAGQAGEQPEDRSGEKPEGKPGDEPKS